MSRNTLDICGNCSVCGALLFRSAAALAIRAHVCPPLWQVRHEDHHDPEDPEDYSEVRSHSLEGAAEEYAEHFDDERYLLRPESSEGWKLLITDTEGKQSTVWVRAEATVVYRTRVEGEAS